MEKYPKLKEFNIEDKTVHFKNYFTFMEMSVIVDNMLKTDNTVLRTYVKWFYYLKYLTDLTDFDDIDTIDQDVREKIDYYNAWGLIEELDYELNSSCAYVISEAIEANESTASVIKAFTDTLTDSMNKALKNFSKEDVNTVITKLFDNFKELRNANNSK